MKKNAILLMAVVSLFVSNKQMANAEDNTATQKDSTGISVDSLEKMSDKELESMTQVPLSPRLLYMEFTTKCRSNNWNVLLL